MRKRLIAITLSVAVGGGAAGGLAAWSIYHTFGIKSRAYIFANWENYMSPGLQSHLADKYDVGFTNYGTNSDLVGLYVDGSYDAAIPSDYLIPQLAEKGALRQIDWSQFTGHFGEDDGSKMLTPNEMPAYYGYGADGTLLGNYPNDGLKAVEPSDPINLFNDVVKRQIVQFRGFSGAQFNLLKYGVPYFMQDLVFAYRGPEIPELKDPQNNDYTWKDILAVANKFKDNMEIIDDERNVYSIGRSINTEDNGAYPDGSTINPSESEKTNLDPAFQSFGNAVSGAGKILWDTDSYGVLNYLSKWNNTNAPRAAILYNGDAVYSALGGEVGAGAQKSADFHVVHPKTTVFVMDMITISSKTDAERLSGLVDMVNELALSGMYINKNNPDYQAEGDDATPWAQLVKDKDGTGDEEGIVYANMSMQNFNNVNYVSPAADMDEASSEEYWSDNDEYSYTDSDGAAQTVLYADLYDEDGSVHMTDATGADLGVAEDGYEGPLLYTDANGVGHAVTPTGKNIAFDIYKVKTMNIVSRAIEAPFTDEQQTASLRYFYDLKQRLD